MGSEKTKVKDVMVPLEEYAMVSEDAVLFDAVLVLEEAQERFQKSQYAHRAILVSNKDSQVVGKMSQLDVIAAIEPEFKKLIDSLTSKYNLSSEAVSNLKDLYNLWRKNLKDLCKQASDIYVKDIYSPPEPGEYIHQDKSLDEGIHQLLIGKYQSLLVTEDDTKVVGVLRLTDIFTEIAEKIKTCKVQ